MRKIGDSDILFCDHFVVGYEIPNYTPSINKTDLVNAWLDILRDNNNKLWSKAISIDIFTTLLPLDDVSKIINELKNTYKKNYPFSKKTDFIEYCFGYTIHRCRELIKYNTTILDINIKGYDIYYYSEYITHDRLYFAIPQKESIEKYKQYLIRFIDLVEDVNYDSEDYSLQQESPNKDEEQSSHQIIKTIKKHLAPHKESGILSEVNFNNLLDYLNVFFDKGSFPENCQTINVGRINKKLFGKTLNAVFEDLSYNNEKLSFEYLRFAKEYISIFKGAELEKENFTKSNLYSYFKTKTL